METDNKKVGRYLHNDVTIIPGSATKHFELELLKWTEFQIKSKAISSIIKNDGI